MITGKDALIGLSILALGVFFWLTTVQPFLQDNAVGQSIRDARNTAVMQGRSPDQAEAEIRDYVRRMKASTQP